MSESNIDNIAENAANIEKIFNEKFGYELGKGDYKVEDNITIHNTEYKILADYDFNRSGIDFYQKAVVLKNMDTGEVYFHFNGTGDGNWGYNAAAYGVEPQPSDMQKSCLLWFDMTMEELKADGTINDNSSVYVTGHSQGGNNAMFVTIRSKYGDDIDACVPLDGPDFSNKFVDDTMAILGENEYNSRCDKIWAYTGENDYVDFLGQRSIVPEGHTKYVAYSKEGFDFSAYHCADGLIDENGKMTIVGSDSEFRQMLNDFVKQIPKLPQEEQTLVANTIMAICENYITSEGEFRTSDISPEDFRRTLEILTPDLAELLKEHPNEIGTVIVEIFNLDPNVAPAITDFIEQYGQLEKADREAFIAAIFDLIKIEDNKISIDLTKLDDAYVVLSYVADKTIFDPDNILEVLERSGITSDPIKYGATFLIVLGWKVMDLGLELIIGLIDAVATIFEAIKDFCGKVADVFVKMFEAVKTVINKIKDWWRKKTNKGVKYVKENPYFKADTDKLREYASRLNILNSRLRSLDSSMRSLYWQVGFSDLWDILCANLLTCESSSLKKACDYLNKTAERLITADNKAIGYMGG